MAFTCELDSKPIPKSESEIAVVTMTAKVIVRLRRSPIRTSLSKNPARMYLPYPVNPLARVSVDAANLVANHMAAIEFNNALAHLINDSRIVGGHQYRGALAVNPIK